MKNRFESAEIFESYVILDLLHLELEEIRKELNVPRHGIDIMIDKATGYDKRHLPRLIEIMKDMIKYKKIVEIDFSKDQAFLGELELI